MPCAAAVTVQSCVRTWKKRRADRSARRFSAWGKKMEKEKERMHKTFGGGAVTRRRSWGEADYFVLSLARSKVTVSFSVSPLRETVSVALSPAE